MGKYRFELEEQLGSKTIRYDITYEDEHLVGYWPDRTNPLLGAWLAPLGAGMFHAVQLVDDEVFDIVTDIVYEFTPLNGCAGEFELRVIGDESWGVHGARELRRARGAACGLRRRRTWLGSIGTKSRGAYSQRHPDARRALRN